MFARLFREIASRRALALVHRKGAILHGHFIGTQGAEKGLGLHMPVYVDGRVLVTDPRAIAKLARAIARRLRRYNVKVVVGMPIGAYTLGHEVAKYLGAAYVMAERDSSGVAIVRSCFVEAVRGRRVAIVEDTVNAGETLLQGIEAVRRCDGDLVAIGALFNRQLVDECRFGVPFHPLIRQPTVNLTREECLEHGQCSRLEPIDLRPGHGHDLERLVLSGRFPDAGYTFR